MSIYIPSSIECGAADDIAPLDFDHDAVDRVSGDGLVDTLYGGAMDPTREYAHRFTTECVFPDDFNDLLDIEEGIDAEILEDGLWDEGLDIGLEEEYEDAV